MNGYKRGTTHGTERGTDTRIPVPDWQAGSDVSTLLRDDDGRAIIPISDIMEMCEQDKWELLQRGYEASKCNDEGAVDYGTTIQFYMEDKFYRHPYHTQFSRVSLDLYGTVLSITCKALWKANFPNDINPEVRFEREARRRERGVW